MKPDSMKRVWSARGILIAVLVVPLLWSGMARAAETADPAAPGGSQGAPAAPSAPESLEATALRHRAAGFWLARVNRDIAAQYEYLEPRVRARTPVKDWVQSQGGGVVEFLAYQVEEASIQGSFATVKVRLLVRPQLPIVTKQRVGPRAVTVQDEWVRVDGAWYRVENQVRGQQSRPKG